MGKGEEGGQEGEKMSKKLPLKLCVVPEVSFIALKPHVISFSNESVEAGGIAEGRSSSGVMAST